MVPLWIIFALLLSISTPVRGSEAALKKHFPHLESTQFDIPVTVNKEVLRWIRYYQGLGKDFFRRYVERSGRYAPLMATILQRLGLPQDLIYLAMAESGMNNMAISKAQAVGPWQFMQKTAKQFGLKVNSYVDERRDPIKATIAAGRYLQQLYQIFGHWELAAAAYNAGEGKVAFAIKNGLSSNFWKLREGAHLAKETKDYLPRIMALAILGKNLNSFGFKEINFHTPMDFEEVELSPRTDLWQVAQLSGIPYNELEKLNPELLFPITPPQEKVYPLRVPVGSKKILEKCCQKKDLTAKYWPENSDPLKPSRYHAREVLNQLTR